MAKRLILPGFTVLLGITIFIAFYAFSDGASELQASYPPLAYPNPTGWPTGTAASGVGATPSPMLFVPGMHKSAIGGPAKGLAWVIKTGRAVTDAAPFNISWYHTWGLYPPNLNPANPWPATVGAEFVPFDPCKILNISSYPDHLSKDYTGYMLFLNEPDNDDPKQCGGKIGENNVISSTEIYSKVVAKYPNAKLIGPNTTFNIRYGGEITGFLDAWINRVITMGLPLPYGYGIHLYPSPTIEESAEEWTQAYCELLEAYDELDKELWVTEFGWSNDWVEGTNDATRQVDMNMRIEDQFGFFETGLTTDEEQECEITRYAWFTNRNKLANYYPPGIPTPTATPTSPVGYTDLYWYWTLTRSYVGNTYVDFGTLIPPTSTP